MPHPSNAEGREPDGLFGAERAAASEPFAVLPEFPENATGSAGALTAARPVARRPALALAVLAAATFLGALDLLIVNVALDPIGRAIGETDLANLGWILNAYAIVFAALLVPAGRLADRIGRKAGFLAGLAIFAGASLGAAVVGDLWWLVAFRVFQAAGAALLTPASLGLVLGIAPEGKVTKYVQIWAASGSLAAAAGPVLGGVLVEASWRWVFLINVPVAVLVILVARWAIPDLPSHGDTRVPDVIGTLLFVVGIGGFALGLVKAPDWGWLAGPTLIVLALAVLAGILFVVRSGRVEVPLVDLKLFRDPVFASANAAAGLFYASFVMQLLGIILWLQTAGGWSPIETGLAIAPGPCMVFVASVLARRLERRIAVGVIAFAGATLSAVGIAYIALATGDLPVGYPAEILPGWIVGGIGIGLMLPTVFSAATRDLPEHQAATGSAVVNMAGQAGSVLGASVLIAILAGGATDAHAEFATAWWVAAGVAVVSAIAALRISPPAQRRD